MVARSEPQKMDGAYCCVAGCFSGGCRTEVRAFLPRETELLIRVNGYDLTRIACTPVNLCEMVLGFLFSEGVISCLDDVLLLKICDEEYVAEVRLKRDDFKPVIKRITSGCGGGVALGERVPKVVSALKVSLDDVSVLMRRLRRSMRLYKVCGGVHASALCTQRRILFIAEDIGRHNTLDKIFGMCLTRGISPEGKMVLTTGRVSGEMLEKLARVGVPVVATQRIPTDTAVILAEETGVTLLARVRGKNLLVFTHPERLSSSSV